MSARVAPAGDGGPVVWTYGDTPATTVTYSGTSPVDPEETWTATDLFGLIATAGAGPPPPEYVIHAREAAVKITGFVAGCPPYGMEVWYHAEGKAGWPEGVLDGHFESEEVGGSLGPFTISPAPESWSRDGEFDWPVGSAVGTIIELHVTYNPGEGASASDLEPEIVIGAPVPPQAFPPL